MLSRLRLSRDLVLIGGGHAHALVLRMWGMDPLPGARVTLINPAPTAPYTGMLPGYVAGHYTRDQLDIDLVRLCRFAGARLVLDRAVAIGENEVTLAGRPPVGFDVASLDIGIHGQVPGIPGLTEHGVAAKPLGPFADRWDAFLRTVGDGGPPTICVIGGGIAGVELALAMAYRLRGSDAAPDVTIVESSDEPLTSVGRLARQALLRRLREEGVRLLCGTGVARVEADRVMTTDGREVLANLTVAAAGAVPYDWPSRTGLPTTDGYVRISETLAVEGCPGIFAAGDCAHMVHAPRDKAGVYAVRQAPILAANLRAALGGSAPPRTYRPQSDYLKLVSTGSRTAAMDRSGIGWHGAALWRLKDSIDRRFMHKLTALPTMVAKTPDKTATDAIAAEPMCGGCGAKAAKTVLQSALAAVPTAVREDVVGGIGDDAGILRHGDGVQVVTVDTLRAFTADPYLLARIAAIHALGDVWAMGATPQAAVLSVTLPRMTTELQRRTLVEITEAASATLAAAGAALIGGHTALGAEVSVGLTVTGLADHAVGQAGAQSGDVLLLTKPIGTGTLLAGEMAGSARGEDVAACWESMLRPQGRAAEILRQTASAMTDVTGFGLANHAAGLFADEKSSVDWDLSALPILSGALALAEAGTRSSLFADNTAMSEPPGDARVALLYDPQTAGGLLAAIPPERLDETLSRMAAADEPAWIVGRVR